MGEIIKDRLWLNPRPFIINQKYQGWRNDDADIDNDYNYYDADTLTASIMLIFMISITLLFFTVSMISLARPPSLTLAAESGVSMKA